MSPSTQFAIGTVLSLVIAAGGWINSIILQQKQAKEAKLAAEAAAQSTPYGEMVKALKDMQSRVDELEERDELRRRQINALRDRDDLRGRWMTVLCRDWEILRTRSTYPDLPVLPEVPVK